MTEVKIRQNFSFNKDKDEILLHYGIDPQSERPLREWLIEYTKQKRNKKRSKNGGKV